MYLDSRLKDLLEKNEADLAVNHLIYLNEKIEKIRSKGCFVENAFSNSLVYDPFDDNQILGIDDLVIFGAYFTSFTKIPNLEANLVSFRKLRSKTTLKPEVAFF